MTRRHVRRWMSEHPEAVHGEPAELLALCEREVREHADEEAWAQAKRVADRRHRFWADRHTNHASPGHTAREVCAALANDLAHMTPQVREGEEPAFIDDDVRAALEPAALSEIRSWIRDLAIREERREWRRIIRFTRERGQSIPIERRLSFETDWQSTQDYAHTAALVTTILSEEYGRHATVH